MTMRAIVVAGVLLVTVAGSAPAKLGPAARCAALKRKAVGVKVAQKLACHAAAVGRPGGTPDPLCLAKAEHKFQASFARAERKPGCATTGDAGALEARVDVCVADLVAQLPAGGATTTTVPSGTTTTTLPPPPSLGTQIDRAGRAGVIVLLEHSFDADATARGAAKDAYNQASDPATWASSFRTALRTSLGFWDGFDASCGNQLLASSATDQTRYDPLSQLLVDDRLYVDTTSGTCDAYLGVEMKAAGLIGGSDCGGRRPGVDTTDASYSLLTIGLTSGVSDGVSAGDASISTSFPFLGAPH